MGWLFTGLPIKRELTLTQTELRLLAILVATAKT